MNNVSVSTIPTIIPWRLEALKNAKLENGVHVIPPTSPEDARVLRLCALEAAAWLVDEPHTDRPVCVSPVIAQFLRVCNDGIRNSDARTRLLLPLVPLIVGSNSTDEVERKREFILLDWMVREFAPIWMAQNVCCIDSSSKLRTLEPLVDCASARRASDVVLDECEKHILSAEARLTSQSHIRNKIHYWNMEWACCFLKKSIEGCYLSSAHPSTAVFACDAGRALAESIERALTLPDLLHIQTFFETSARDLIERLVACK